jgi:hypothetical protein
MNIADDIQAMALRNMRMRQVLRDRIHL